MAVHIDSEERLTWNAVRKTGALEQDVVQRGLCAWNLQRESACVLKECSKRPVRKRGRQYLIRCQFWRRVIQGRVEEERLIVS